MASATSKMAVNQSDHSLPLGRAFCALSRCIIGSYPIDIVRAGRLAASG
jgi:hypothetical protein